MNTLAGRIKASGEFSLIAVIGRCATSGSLAMFTAIVRASSLGYGKAADNHAYRKLQMRDFDWRALRFGSRLPKPAPSTTASP